MAMGAPTMKAMTTVDHALDGFEFPAGPLVFGCSTAGYQVEGAFNGPGDPKNNWYWAEERGDKARTGDASQFLTCYEEDLDRAAWLGLTGFRLGLEWARLQPVVDVPAGMGLPGYRHPSPPPFSASAVERYADIIAAVQRRGMIPAVTLFHWTYPLWAAPDLLLDWERFRELFSAYVTHAVTEINRLLVTRHGQGPIPYIITMNEPIAVPLSTYVLKVFPKGDAKGLAAAATCYENILRAHVLAYRLVHRIYREQGWPSPTVTCNSWCAANYAMDKIGQDLFLVRHHGVGQADVPAFLAAQRAAHQALFRAVPYRVGPQALKRGLEAGVDRLLLGALGNPPLAGLVGDIYSGDDGAAGPGGRLADAVGFDLYDPFLLNNLDWGFPRLVHPRISPWEWGLCPEALLPAVRSYHQTGRGLPIHLLEHGMAVRGDKEGPVTPHRDGIRRDEALKRVMLAMVETLKTGLPLETFYYWSLVDNYEWGSFQPRFGLFAVDYANGARRLKTDALGVNAAGCYKLFIEAFRARDANALRAAFAATVYPEVPF